ncbi:hypothetical protein H7J91_07825 [Mycolicibacterium rhodesiae]|nr:hypothetical protein [Mycolicibacterium rhodesiae]
MPVPAIVDGGFAIVGSPDSDMGCARADFVIAAGAPVGLDRPRSGYRLHFVVESVGARLDAALQG